MSSSSLPPIGALEHPEGRTRNDWEPQRYARPPVEVTPEHLKHVREMRLSGRAASEPMSVLVSALVTDIAALPGRQRGIGEARRPKVEAAVCGVLADVVAGWEQSPPHLSYRSRVAGAFTGLPVGFATFVSAVDGLTELGLLHRLGGVRYQAGARFGFSDGGPPDAGKAARYWPTERLLEVLEAAGIAAGTIGSHTRHEYPSKPPAIPRPILIRPLRLRGGPREEAEFEPDYAADAEARQLRAAVVELNEFVAGFDVRGCLPPRWCRRFTGSLALHGRLYSVGSGGAYQSLTRDERAGITIAGEAVTEVDIQASWLTILHGLHRLPLPTRDLYDLPGLPRAVVKAWMVATFGKGSPVRRWSKETLAKEPAAAQHKAETVAAAAIAAYPFLSNLAAVTAHLDVPEGARGVLSGYLMTIEAAAIIGAVQHMKARGLLALPIHDALIVGLSAVEAARGCLTASFAHFARIAPRLGISRP